VGLLRDEFGGMQAEVIYERIKNEAPPEGGALAGDLLPSAPSEDADALAATIRGRVAQAATAARLAGQMPADIARAVQSILAPSIPWQEMLRHFMTARTNTRSDWSRRNRRFTSIYLPTRTGKQMRKIGVILDTSGSIDDRLMSIMASEVHAIGADVGAEETHVKFASTKTVHEQRFMRGEPIVLQPKGGGGTDMRAPLGEFEAEETPPDVVVLLTDGYTPWPQVEPAYPLIVCCTTNVAIPVGVEVRING
jgi:predicted metal-dependent peptidase